MGYDLHITRAAEWWGENAGCEIGEAEWLGLVDADPELRRSTPEDVCHSENLVLWSGNEPGGPWLAWRRGNVYSKNPNARLIEKMLEIAERLQARVLGDDSEVYLPGGRVQDADGEVAQDVDWRAG